MIIRISFLVLIVILIKSVFAQELEKSGYFGIGVEGGPQITNVAGFADLYNPVSKVGFCTGIYGEYYINNDFRIKLGMHYDNRRFEIEGYLPYLASPVDEDSIFISYSSYYLYQVDYSINYLTFPLGLVYAKGNEKFKVNVQASFYYSLLLFANKDGLDNYYIDPDHAGYLTQYGQQGNNIYEYSGSTEGFAYNQDSTQIYFNNYDLGFNFIVGLSYYPSDRLSINAGVGFTLGISNLFQDDRINSGWSQQTKFNIGIAYLLNKKNKTFGTK